MAGAASDGARTAVLHVGPDADGRGGMPAVIRSLVSSPLAADYRMSVLTTWSTARPLVRVAVFGAALLRLCRWCLGRGPRIVHVHAAMRGSLYRKAACVAAARVLRRPVLLHVHAGPGDIAAFAARLGRARRRAFRRAFLAADEVLAVSTASAEALRSAFGVGGATIVPNAAPPGLEPAPPAAGSGVPAILYLGGFANPVKGGATLVAALPEILVDRPDVEVTAAGPGTPPDALVELTRSHPTVRWAGWLGPADKAEALRRHDVFVLPSLSEGLPVALLEAMANGRAVVATTVGGVPDVVDGEQALLVEPDRPDLLAAATRRLVADARLRARLGLAARERAAELNARDVWGRLREVYEGMT